MATAIAAVTVFLKMTSDPVGLRLLIGGLVAFVTYLLAYAVAACFMPPSFFENYGAGRRVMRFANTETGQETSTILRTLTVFLIISLALMAYVMRSTFNR